MANGFEIEGTVHVINEIQTFDSGFSKREFVVEVQDGKFPQMLKFECLKDKTSLLDGLNKGDAIKVNFDIRGNEYNGKFYVNLNAWKIERNGASTGMSPSQGEGDIDQTISEPPAGYGQPDTGDDIPF